MDKLIPISRKTILLKCSHRWKKSDINVESHVHWSSVTRLARCIRSMTKNIRLATKLRLQLQLQLVLVKMKLKVKWLDPQRKFQMIKKWHPHLNFIHLMSLIEWSKKLKSSWEYPNHSDTKLNISPRSVCTCKTSLINRT